MASKTTPLPSKSRLRELFEYDWDTGNLIWKKRPLSEFKTVQAGRTWNARECGTVAGYIEPRGYRIIFVGEGKYSAHRLVWAYHHYDPEELQIDHINQTKTDNRIQNLRPVTNTENNCNVKLRANNTSGCVGVSWSKRARKWHAQIKANGKRIHIGLFSEKDAAIAARDEASKRFGFHKNHGKAA